MSASFDIDSASRDAGDRVPASLRPTARRRVDLAGILTKAAMASWVLLAAMPAAVLILAFT